MGSWKLPLVALAGLLAAAVLAIGCQQIREALDRARGGEGPGAGGGADPMDDGDWAALKAEAMGRVKVAPGWSAPELLPGQVNSTGWEDSAAISPDGLRLYFAYLPCDFHGLVVHGGLDLNKFEQYRRGPDRGNTPAFAFETFVSENKDGVFQKPRMAWISRNSDPPHASESGACERDGFIYYNNNHPALPDQHTVHIWRAPLNGPGVKLPFCGPTDESDPAFLDGELYFWSEHRPGNPGGGKKYLWMTRQTGPASWTEPVCLPAPVNLRNSDSWQCHPTPDGRLFFTSDRDGSLAIWAARRAGPLEWDAPSKVVWVDPGGPALGVAEPSLPDDASVLYFCVLFKNQHGRFDLDIARTRRTGP